MCQKYKIHQSEEVNAHEPRILELLHSLASVRKIRVLLNHAGLSFGVCLFAHSHLYAHTLYYGI